VILGFASITRKDSELGPGWWSIYKYRQLSGVFVFHPRLQLLRVFFFGIAKSQATEKFLVLSRPAQPSDILQDTCTAGQRREKKYFPWRMRQRGVEPATFTSWLQAVTTKAIRTSCQWQHCHVNKQIYFALFYHFTFL
jgi:hypothetical protein